MQTTVKRTRNVYRKGANLGTKLALRGTNMVTMPVRYVARKTPKPIRGYTTKIAKLPSNTVRLGGRVVRAAPNTAVRAISGMGLAARDVLGAMTMPVISLILPPKPKRKKAKPLRK